MAQRFWFTADLHMGHGNIIKYCQRPHLTEDELKQAILDPRGKWRVSPETVQRHDAALIDAINAHVAQDDVLWILGDFCWGDFSDAQRYRNRIACRNVHFVWGNHDKQFLRPLFGQAIEQGMITVNGQSIWLNHYPMRSWDGSFHGSWQLYGHVHGRLAAEDAANDHMLTKDVGVDACDYRPWSFEDLSAYMAPRIVKFQQRKAAMTAGEGGTLV